MSFGPSDPSIVALLSRLIPAQAGRSAIRSLGTAAHSLGNPFSAGGGTQSSQLGASPNIGTFRKVPNPALGADLLNAGLSGIGDIGAAISSGQVDQTDPLQQLYQNLINQLQAPVSQPGAINTQDLMNQVQAAINPIYDAREAAVRAQAQQGQAAVTGLYQQLADENAKLAPQQVAQSKDAQNQINQLYGQLRSNIEGSYSRITQEQADEFKQLGIQDALPQVLGKQNDAVTDATTAASQNQAAAQQRYMDIGQTDADYYRQQAPIAVMRGNEEATNILNQLQNYIGQAEGDRASGIQTGYLQQLGQAQQLQASQQAAANAETNQHQQMLWQILQSQLQAQSQAQNQKVTPDSFVAGLPANVQQSVASAFNSLQRSPEAIYGKVQDPRSPVPGTFVNTTPQWYESQADKMYQSGQIDAATHQALLMYIQLYYGTGQ